METSSNITGYLWKTLLFTFLVSALFTFLLIQIIYSANSDGLEGKQAALLNSIAGVLWALALTLCSLTVFFNIYPRIRQHKIYSFLSYYLVPLIALIAVVVSMGFSEPKTVIQFLVTNIPFFAVQGYFFWKFKSTSFE